MRRPTLDGITFDRVMRLAWLLLFAWALWILSHDPIRVSLEHMGVTVEHRGRTIY